MHRIGTWLAGMVTLLGGGCLLAIFSMNLLRSAHVSPMEAVSFTPAGLLWLLPLGLILSGIWLLLRWEKNISERGLFWFFAAIYIVAGLVLVFSVSDVLRADALFVYQAAAAVEAGDLSSFAADGYLGIYPQQLGLLAYDLFWRLFSDSPRILFLANLACILGINWFVRQMANLLFHGNHRVNLLTIALCFAFLPSLFYVLYAYGLQIGFFFFCMGVWMLLHVQEKNGGFLWMIGGAACLVLAAFLKQNYLIGLLAVCLWELVLLAKERRGRHGAVLAAVLLLYLGFHFAVPVIVEKVTGVTLCKGAPAVLWMAMGTDPANDMRCYGWYNGYNWDTFAACGYNTGLAAEVGWAKLRENLAWFWAHPADFFHYFGIKAASTWCEPTFASVWAGPLEWCGQSVHTDRMRSLYHQGTAFWLVYHGMKGLLMLLYGAALAGVVLLRKHFSAFGLPCLYLLGGVLFHLVWETKSLYVYTYVFLLLPLCAYALARGYSRLTGGEAP